MPGPFHPGYRGDIASFLGVDNRVLFLTRTVRLTMMNIVIMHEGNQELTTYHFVHQISDGREGRHIFDLTDS
jgi:hypothetical protein